MELKIDPEAVNKFVADAVLNSAIGDAVKKAVENELEKLTSVYNNPFESVVRTHVTGIALTVLREEYDDVIREKVAAALAKSFSTEFINRICDKALERY